MPVYSQVAAIEFHLPGGTVSNAELAALSADWTEDKILQKTGVSTRHIVGPEEFASDLAFQAAERLFASHAVRRDEVDFLIYITQSPEQFMPATACLLQSRLGLPMECGAIDLNQGCSGYVYGLGVAAGLIESGQSRGVLLLCADTVSKYLAADDLGVRTLFGDGGAATWIVGVESEQRRIGPFVHGTDGRGGPNLCVQGGGLRTSPDVSNHPPRMSMDGPEVFAFTMSRVPAAVRGLLAKAQREIADIDLVVFHQANAFVLEHLRNKLKIPADRFLIDMEETGNTTSSSIPIALQRASVSGRLRSGMRVLVVGFGVGYSWSAALLTWP